MSSHVFFFVEQRHVFGDFVQLKLSNDVNKYINDKAHNVNSTGNMGSQLKLWTITSIT